MNVLEKILEEIREVEKEYVVGHNVMFALCATGMAAGISGIIRSHMDEAAVSNHDDNWIPVVERLPEDERMVLVTCQTKKGIRSTNRAYYDGKFWHGSGSMSGVTAWQPLPEPYKEV